MLCLIILVTVDNSKLNIYNIKVVMIELMYDIASTHNRELTIHSLVFFLIKIKFTTTMIR